MKKYFLTMLLLLLATPWLKAGDVAKSYNLANASSGAKVITKTGETTQQTQQNGVQILAGSEAQIELPSFDVQDGKLALQLDYIPPFIHQFMWYDGRVLELKNAKGEKVLTLDIVRRGRFRLEYQGVGKVSLPMDKFQSEDVKFIIVIDNDEARLEVNGQTYLTVIAKVLENGAYNIVLANAISDAEKICAYGTYQTFSYSTKLPGVAPAYNPGANDADYAKLKALENRIVTGENELKVKTNNSGIFSSKVARQTVCRVVLDSLYRRLNTNKRVNFAELYNDLVVMTEAMENDEGNDIIYNLPPDAKEFLSATDDGFYFGMIGWELGQYARDLANLGFNIISDSFWPNQVMLRDGTFNDIYYNSRISPSLINLARYNIKVDMLLAPYSPDYLKQQHPEWTGSYFGSESKDTAEAAQITSSEQWKGRVAGIGFLEASIIHPDFLNMAETFLKESVRRLKTHDNIVSICIGNEPLFADYSPLMQQRWREYLTQKYLDIAALNQAWKSDYKSFEQIFMNYVMAHDYANSPRFYDWTCFNQEVGTEFFKFLHDTVKSESNLPTHVKVLPDEYGYFWLNLNSPDRCSSEYAAGIDRHGIAQFTDIIGTDSYADKWTGDGDLLSNTMYQTIYLDLIASYNYKKSIFDSEWHIFNINAPRTPAQYADMVMQENVMHGIQAGSVWLMNPEVDAYDLTTDAPLLLTYAQTGAKIRSFGKYYDALLNRERPVALLYSPENRRTFFDEYMNNLRTYHEASLFNGAGLRVLDERQLIAGDYDGVKTIVVTETPILTPATKQALINFGKNGGKIILIDKAGQKNKTNLSVKECPGLLNIIQAKSLSMLDTPKYISSGKGANLHGVEWHYANLPNSNEVIIYVTNYNKNPQMVFLNKLKNPRNSLTNQALKFPMEFGVWQTLLIIAEK